MNTRFRMQLSRSIHSESDPPPIDSARDQQPISLPTQLFPKFLESIYSPAEFRCAICTRLMYKTSITPKSLNRSQVDCLNATGFGFQTGSKILLCETCARSITQVPPRISPQSYYNHLASPPIPPELLALTPVEVDFCDA